MLFARVKYGGDLPKTFTGQFTRQKYTWTEERPVIRVDRRDMPGLRKEAGRDNLEGGTT